MVFHKYRKRFTAYYPHEPPPMTAGYRDSSVYLAQQTVENEANIHAAQKQPAKRQ
jgi:hypothetical protein